MKTSLLMIIMKGSFKAGDKIFILIFFPTGINHIFTFPGKFRWDFL